MKYNPKNPKWLARDRYVQSNGHSCALLYSMLHLSGYNLSLDDLKAFRQVDSMTPGHPESHLTPGVEVTTGPLGQGISNAVGLAMAQSHLAATFNKPGFDIFDNYTYVICGDGCLQEGVSSEACSLAGHLGLGRLIVLWDDNKITIDGSTDLSFTEDVLKRYESYGWQTLTVKDGDNDTAGIAKAIETAKKETGKPTIIKVSTTIGFGSSKQGTEKVHGAPLGPDDLAATKKKLGFNPDASFEVKAGVKDVYAKQAAAGAEAEAAWNSLLGKYTQANPKEGAEIARFQIGELPKDWEKSLPTWKASDGAEATRKTSEKVIQAITTAIPEIMGGSADLTPSNNTLIKSSHDYQKATPDGRYIRYGVREHGMAAICNGLAAYGAIIPYCGTFLNFIGYAFGAVRISAVAGHRVIYVMTHDSIGLGEDGPTHQPTESLAMTRAMPNILTFRPADGNETAGAYACALNQKNRPSVIALSRQGLPQLEKSAIPVVALGAYTAKEAEGGKPAVVIVATGSEVSLALKGADALAKEGIAARVVSMPCMELFDEQPEAYRTSILPPGVPVLSVEAQTTFGWAKYANDSIGMTSFGASGPGGKIMEKFGFTVGNIVARCQALVKK